MDYGIKISQPGFDVKTCDDKDLVMSSKFNLLKTCMVGVIPTGEISVAHGLAYVPIYFTSTDFGSGKHSLIGEPAGSMFTLETYCDETYLYSPEGTKYYIFHQQSI